MCIAFACTWACNKSICWYSIAVHANSFWQFFFSPASGTPTKRQSQQQSPPLPEPEATTSSYPKRRRISVDSAPHTSSDSRRGSASHAPPPMLLGSDECDVDESTLAEIKAIIESQEEMLGPEVITISTLNSDHYHYYTTLSLTVVLQLPITTYLCNILIGI